MEKRITNYKRVLVIKHVQKNIEKVRSSLIQLSERVHQIEKIFSNLYDEKVEDYLISEFQKVNSYLEKINLEIENQLEFLKNPKLDKYRDQLLEELQYQISNEIEQSIKLLYALLNYNNRKIKYYEKKKEQERNDEMS